MARSTVRALKRQLSALGSTSCDAQQRQLAQDSAVALLGRSIRFGHGRLAVVRLAMAVHAGAQVPDEHWRYCQDVIRQARDQMLVALWEQARHQAARSGVAGVH